MLNETFLQVLGLTVVIILVDVLFCSFITFCCFGNVKENIKEVGFIINIIFFGALLSAVIIMIKL